MSPTIRVSCPTCGEQSLLAREITLRICIDTGKAEYRFVCISCGVTVTRGLNERQLAVLTPHPTEVEHYYLPCELFDAERHTDLPPLVADDVIDLMLELERQ